MQATELNAAGENQYFTVSQYKFSVMYIMTLGLYSVYWFYKNWKLQQPYMEKTIWPTWRAVFSIFFTHSLFERIRLSAEQRRITTNYSYGVMASSFVVLMIVGNVLGNLETEDSFGVISIISVLILMIALYPLYMVQDTINQLNNDPHGVFNNDITLINYVFIVLGFLIWLILFLLALVNFGVIHIAA